jgi:hypothetical protein
MKNKLTIEQGEYFNQIEDATISVSNGYRNVCVSKTSEEQEKHLLILKDYLEVEQSLYDGIDKDCIVPMINYFNEVLSIWSSKQNNNGFITDKLNSSYQTYHNLLLQKEDNLWFNGMQEALINRVLVKLIQHQTGESFMTLATNTIDKLVYSSLLEFLDEMIKSNNSRSIYYEFVKYNLIIRFNSMESCFWNKYTNDESSNLQEEYLSLLQDQNKDKIFELIENKVKQILDHLFSLTDDKMENLSANTRYIASIDSIMLRGYIMLLDEEHLIKMMKYSDNQFNYDANKSNHLKSKKLIKKSFESYQDDRNKYLGN